MYNSIGPSKKRAASGNNNNTEQPRKARMSRQSSAGRAKASSGKSPHSTKLELLASKYNLALVNRLVALYSVQLFLDNDTGMSANVPFARVNLQMGHTSVRIRKQGPMWKRFAPECCNFLF